MIIGFTFASMRRDLFKSCKLIVIAIACFAPIYSAFSQNNNSAERVSQKIIAHFVQQQFDSIYQMQDKEMKRQLDAKDYEMLWQNFIEKYDTVVNFSFVKTILKDSFVIAESKLSFVSKDFLLHITLNKNNQIAGLFFKSPQVEYTPPNYINTLNFIEIKKKIKTGNISCDGILTLPKNKQKIPLVIIVGGSGPTDKDGSIGVNKPYKDIAWGLADKGIAVFRYDKRTVNTSIFKNINPTKVNMEFEYLLDLKSIIKQFKNDKTFSMILFAGHSQGGFMIPYFQTNLSSISGFIGLSANYSSVVDLLPKQLYYLQSLQKDSASKAAINILIEKANYTALHRAKRDAVQDSLFPGLTPAYIKHMETNKPEVLINKIMRTPLLFIQGKRDYQVQPEELVLWQTALKDACCAKFVQFEKLNHILIEGEGVPSPQEYSIQGNVPEYVINEIALWINSLTKN